MLRKLTDSPSTDADQPTRAAPFTDPTQPSDIARTREAGGGPVVEFAFLDGIRGVSAVAIALLHTWLFTGHTGDTSRAFPMVARVVERFNFAVPIFIVLSGFVLMLPVLRSPTLDLPGGLRRYVVRRARRILPPYYGALVLFVTLISLVPLLGHPQGTRWDDKLPVSAGALVSHLLLVHNIQAQWAFKIDGPLWSVATEWQIYFIMPVILLPVWRRLGAVRTLPLLVAAGFLMFLLLPRSVSSAHLWYIGLFAMGMAAAQMVQTGNTPEWLPRFTYIAVAASLIALSIPLVYRQEWLLEPCIGATAPCCVVTLALREKRGQMTTMRRVLESKLLRWLGLWSFSIYLVHSPLLAFGNLSLLRFRLTTLGQITLMMSVVLPLALACCYGFHRLVERRFLTSHQRAKSPENQLRNA